jgi:hypothetical protein
VEIDLDKYFLQAFGFSSEAFKPTVKPIYGDAVFLAPIPPSIRGYRTEFGKTSSPYYAKAGDREYYLPMEVQVGANNMPGTETTYAKALGVKDDKGVYTGRWQLPFPVMSADLIAHVIDTELTERNGMVSELINLSGYRIKVRGLLVNQKANEFPEDDYNTLTNLASLNAPVTLHGVRTDILFMNSGNTNKQVTIRGLHFPERPGVKHVQPYELDMVTEMPFNLVDIS